MTNPTERAFQQSSWNSRIRVPRSESRLLTASGIEILQYPHQVQSINVQSYINPPNGANTHHKFFLMQREPTAVMLGDSVNEVIHNRMLNHGSNTRWVPILTSIPYFTAYKCVCPECQWYTTMNSNRRTVFGYANQNQFENQRADVNIPSGHMYAFVADVSYDINSHSQNWLQIAINGLFPWLYNVRSDWMELNGWENEFPNTFINVNRVYDAETDFHDAIFPYIVRNHHIWPNRLVLYLPFISFETTWETNPPIQH